MPGSSRPRRSRRLLMQPPTTAARQVRKGTRAGARSDYTPSASDAPTPSPAQEWQREKAAWGPCTRRMPIGRGSDYCRPMDVQGKSHLHPRP
jgi:hypothetical protein